MNTLTSSVLTHNDQSVNISGKKKKIFDFFERNQSQSFTSHEVDEVLGIKDSYKRISELLRDGSIMMVGNVKLNKKWCNKYTYSSPEHRNIFAKAMFQQDFKNWIKQGERFKDLVEINIK